MEKINVRYIPVVATEAGKPQKYSHVELGLFYSAGVSQPRGYYLSVLPVTRRGLVTEYTPSEGSIQCVLPVQRRSQKALAKASALAEAGISNALAWARYDYGIVCERPTGAYFS